MGRARQVKADEKKTTTTVLCNEMRPEDPQHTRTHTPSRVCEKRFPLRSSLSQRKLHLSRFVGKTIKTLSKGWILALTSKELRRTGHFVGLGRRYLELHCGTVLGASAPLLANMSINNELPSHPSPNCLIIGYSLQHQPSLKCGLKLAYRGPLKWGAKRTATLFRVTGKAWINWPKLLCRGWVFLPRG